MNIQKENIPLTEEHFIILLNAAFLPIQSDIEIMKLDIGKIENTLCKIENCKQNKSEAIQYKIKSIIKKDNIHNNLNML